VVYPLLVIAAIAAAIWWLGYRSDGATTSSSGEQYGPVDLPAALVPAGAEIQAKEGALAPDFLLETLEGDDLRMSSFRGRPVVVNFWATWCTSCREEIPQLAAAYDRFSDDALVIIGVDLQESVAAVRRFADEFGMQFPVVIDKDGRVADRYRLLGVPTTYFIDRDGLVRSVFTGPFLAEGQSTTAQGAITESQLERRIGEILE
jgi:peroxiredoxin